MGEHLVVFLAWEGGFADGQQVEDDSNAEEIADWVVLCLQILEIDHLRGHIAWSSAPDEEIRVVGAVFSQPEVSNNTIIIVVLPQQYILRLEIPMHDLIVMHNLQSFQNALHDHLDLHRGELMPILDLIVKLAALQQFHTDINGVLRLIDSVQFH